MVFGEKTLMYRLTCACRRSLVLATDLRSLPMAGLIAIVIVIFLSGCATPAPPPPPGEAVTDKTPPSDQISIVSVDNDVQTRQLVLARTENAVDPDAVGYFMDVFRARVRRDLTDTGITIDPRETSILVTFPNQLGFEFGSAQLTTEAVALIDRLAAILREYRATLIVISGHTDNVGDPIFNQQLSEARARSVAEHLSDVGIGQSRLMIQGFGPTRPIENNDTEAGRASNRRVELMLRLVVRQPSDISSASNSA
jgi:outer membrane protein OmpA-like peptidoglycan-associated protein